MKWLYKGFLKYVVIFLWGCMFVGMGVGEDGFGLFVLCSGDGFEIVVVMVGVEWVLCYVFGGCIVVSEGGCEEWWWVYYRCGVVDVYGFCVEGEV